MQKQYLKSNLGLCESNKCTENWIAQTILAQSFGWFTAK